MGYNSNRCFMVYLFDLYEYLLFNSAYTDAFGFGNYFCQLIAADQELIFTIRILFESNKNILCIFAVLYLCFSVELMANEPSSCERFT